jgi:long-chain acyl-CoA synthetase
VSSIGVTHTGEESLTDMVWANAERFGDTVSFRRKVEESWLDVTARAFAGQVLGVAKGLIAAGLRAGDRVALVCGNRYEWPVLAYAIWTAGCVVVPIGDDWPDDGGVRAAIVETDAQRRMVPAGLRSWRLDGELTELGAEVEDARVHKRRLAVGADDLATAEFTHGELLDEVVATIKRYRGLIRQGNSMLVNLPLSHPMARAITLAAVCTRTTLAHSSAITDLSTYRPSVVVTEPGILGKLHATAKLKAHAEDRGRLFDAAETVAVDYGRALKGPGASVTLRGKHLLAAKFVYPKLRVALGGRCVAVIAIGEQLDEPTEKFFLGIGIPVHS